MAAEKKMAKPGYLCYNEPNPFCAALFYKGCNCDIIQIYRGGVTDHDLYCDFESRHRLCGACGGDAAGQREPAAIRGNPLRREGNQCVPGTERIWDPLQGFGFCGRFYGEGPGGGGGRKRNRDRLCASEAGMHPD